MLDVPEHELVSEKGRLVHDYVFDAGEAGSMIEFEDFFADFGRGLEILEDLVELMVLGCGHLDHRSHCSMTTQQRVR